MIIRFNCSGEDYLYRDELTRRDQLSKLITELTSHGRTITLQETEQLLQYVKERELLRNNPKRGTE